MLVRMRCQSLVRGRRRLRFNLIRLDFKFKLWVEIEVRDDEECV